MSFTSTARCSGMPRLALIRHSSLVLLLEELFCGFTVRAEESSVEKITLHTARKVGEKEWKGHAVTTTEI